MSEALSTAATDALAVARITRFVTKDYLTKTPRAALIRWSYGSHDEYLAQATDAAAGNSYIGSMLSAEEVVSSDPDPPKLAYLLTCPWCASAYIAAAVVAARLAAPRVWSPVARALAYSHLAGLGANLDID